MSLFQCYSSAVLVSQARRRDIYTTGDEKCISGSTCTSERFTRPQSTRVVLMFVGVVIIIRPILLEGIDYRI